MDTIVYIDGFNFYYGCVAGTPYKWLNIAAMCERLLPPNKILAVKYFTARVQARPGDLDQPSRQETYFKALRTDPRVEITFGHFLTNSVSLPKADGTGYARVIKTEEKGSDVNLATHLLRDAYLGNFQVGVLVTNDSDLAEPVRIVTQELGKTVGILSPITREGRHASRALTRHATFQKSIRQGLLRSTQFPNPVSSPSGVIRKPASW